MKLSLGFSPCPNDTFIFDALVNKKIDTGEFEFEVLLEDVQTLNEWACHGKLDITKISYGALPLVLQNYILLSSGGALGKGVGPLLIAKSTFDVGDLGNKIVAIPGKNTTAHMLFSLAFPNAKRKTFKVFNEIEDAVLDGEADAGVIIHENRFTYESRGLVKIVDLGDFWEHRTRSPIPLGGIVARRSLDKRVSKHADDLIRASIEYAFENNYDRLTDYVKTHSQAMNENVMRQHIDLYVNNFSVELGEEGKNAVVKLLEVYQQENNSFLFDRNEIFLSQ